MARRRKGEGSITPRKDGRFDVSLTHNKKEYATTVADSTTALAKLEEYRKLAGLSTVEGKFADYCDDWLASKKRSLSPSSVKRYRVELDRRIKEILGDLELQKIDTDHIDGYVTELVDRCDCDAGVHLSRCPNCNYPISSPQQVNYSLRILRAIFERAVLSRKIIWNPAKPVPYLAIDEDEIFVPNFLTLEEVKRFLDHHAQHRLLPLVTVALALGLRSAEARGLRWNDVDLDNGTIHIRWQLTRPHGKWEWVKLKTKKSKTKVRLPDHCLATLKTHRERQSLEKSWAGDAYRDHDLVFCFEDGSPLADFMLLYRFRQMCREADIAPRRFHDLRHTTGHLLAAMKTDQRVIMEALRHSSIKMSIHYSDVPDQIVSDAYGRLEEQMFGGSA